MSVICNCDFKEPSGDNSCILERIQTDLRGAGPKEDLVKFMAVKPGLVLSMPKRGFARVPSVTGENANDPVRFSVLLSGSSVYTAKGFLGRRKMEMEVGSGTTTISAICHTKGHIRFDPDKALLNVTIIIDRPLLYTYVSDSMDLLPEGFDALFEPGKQYYSMTPTSREMADAAMAILRPVDYKGYAQKLYYESRALDLLALHLDRLTGNKASAMPLCRSDIDRIHYARQVIEDNFQEPPTIAALAKMCGVNEHKLKTGFKQTFNTTVYGFVTRVKMEKAWKLLTDDAYSVTRTASEVGYTNISHFISSFNKHFNINPGALKKARSRDTAPFIY